MALFVKISLMEEVIKKILILLGYYIYLLVIAFVVGLPFLIVGVLIANWFYSKYGKRLEEELKKKYEKEREES